MFRKRVKTSLWIFASIGSSPAKKNSEGIGELWDKWRKPLNIFFWNVCNGFKWFVLRVIALKPDLAIGQM